MKVKLSFLPLFLSLLFSQAVFSFEFYPALIPVEEIRPGGPPKDGIPALLKPRFMSAAEATYLQPTDRVVGLVQNHEARAYPIRILNWHEIVNDTIADVPFVVSWCPLCGTAMVFESKIKKEKFTFGVSGLLYNSDVLMYDHQTESLWSQLKMQAVTGKKAGTPLRLVASDVTTWLDWKTRYPKTTVLSNDTGYSRDYSRSPYDGYTSNDTLLFPVSNLDNSRPLKDWVFGLVVGDESKAYPYKELAKTKGEIWDEFAGRQVKIIFDKKNRSVRAETSRGQRIPGVSAYWFAWAAFYPGSQVFKAK